MKMLDTALHAKYLTIMIREMFDTFTFITLFLNKPMFSNNHTFSN